MKSTIHYIFATAVLAASLCGCAAVRQQPVAFTPVTEGQQKALATMLALRLNTGYERSLAAGSRWQHIGRIAQGEVYKPYQHVFTIEGSHIHEAWLVVRDERSLVGFYLPAERSFSSLDPAVSIQLN